MNNNYIMEKYYKSIPNKISKSKNSSSNLFTGIIIEKDLKEIFKIQFDDIFSKILKISQSEFEEILNEQVSIHLKIINKDACKNQKIKYIELYSQQFLYLKNQLTQDYEYLKNNFNNENIIYLNELNCNIHCHKCTSIIHKCGEELILYNDYIYCLNCQKVYNENQIKLYCSSCKKIYYSKLRNIEDESMEPFYPVSFLRYHCSLDNDEIIKCLECGETLYFNISLNNNINKNQIREVYCLKCKYIYDLKEIFFKCKICDASFKSNAQIYPEFSTAQSNLLLLVHTLKKQNLAFPNNTINKKCNCNISNEKFLHHDKGNLFFGRNFEGKLIIVCDCCFGIFKAENFFWNCPVCKSCFIAKKNTLVKNASSTRLNSQKKTNERGLKLLGINPSSIELEFDNNYFHNNNYRNKKSNLIDSRASLYTIGNDLNKYVIEENNNKEFILNKRKSSTDNKIKIFNNKIKEVYKNINSDRDIDSSRMASLKTRDGNTEKTKNKKEGTKEAEEIAPSPSKKKINVQEIISIKNENFSKIISNDEENYDLASSKRFSSSNNLKTKNYIPNGLNPVNKDSNNKENSNRKNNHKENNKVNKNKVNSNRNNNKGEIKIDRIILRKKMKKNKTAQKNNLDKKKNNSPENDSKRIFNKIKNYYIDAANKKNNYQKNMNNKNIYTQELHLKNNYNTNFDTEKYTIIKLLGKGTYAKTYLVKDPDTEEEFALKKIIINDQNELTENEDEYNLLYNLVLENPNLSIVKIFGMQLKKLDKYNYALYILMEAANCDFERELINRSNKKAFFTESQLLIILNYLVDTFAFLQKCGISHRDVKPQNILCFGENGYKISDFGEARRKYNLNIDEDTSKQTLRGTELYMSPILFKALHCFSNNIEYNSFKSDVFSLGMCFFLASCLSYSALYELRESDTDIKVEITINKHIGRRYSKNYIKLLMNMLKINEKDRPDFIELREMLEFC